MLTLYQFPISHYCEKIRWALDYKKLDHEVKNLLPGFHILKTKKLAPRSSVPILVHGRKIIQNSNCIISYLDETFPQCPLTPASDTLRKQALEWERFVDKEVGPHVTRCFYNGLLNQPSIVIPFFTANGPWYAKPLMHLVFPWLRNKMRNGLNINPNSVRQSQESLGLAIDKLNSRLETREFLVGDQFGRADLAAAALLAPLCKPAKYGLDWPQQLPDSLDKLIATYEAKIRWVSNLYLKYR